MYEKLGGRGPSTKKVEGAAAPPAPPRFLRPCRNKNRNKNKNMNKKKKSN